MDVIQGRVIPVRHPITRLFSGFKDIILAGHHGEIGSVRKKVSHMDNVSLLEAYIKTIIPNKDRHFRSYADSCIPCSVDYNAIVKIDDISETGLFFTDSDFVSKKTAALFNESKRVTANVDRWTRHPDWRTYFGKISAQTWIDFLFHYRYDFILFDYNLYFCD